MSSVTLVGPNAILEVLPRRNAFPKEYPNWIYWHINSAYVSPWTGLTWAVIDRGQKFFQTYLRAKTGEKPYTDEIPGSLLLCDETLDELTFPLLERELTVLSDWTSSTLRDSICSTLPEDTMSPSLMEKIAAARVKIAAKEMTDEEFRDLLKAMRQDRSSAAVSAAKSRAKAKGPEINPNDALAAFLA